MSSKFLFFIQVDLIYFTRGGNLFDFIKISSFKIILLLNDIKTFFKSLFYSRAREYYVGFGLADYDFNNNDFYCKTF